VANSATGYGFGTFKGVYTPSLLTILGVVMYLRFGWVLGNVGLGGTLLIVTLSTSITLLTGLSIAGLATNMRIGGGGAYYMISRSLGLEVGAAVGLPLYFAQALGISFYVAGFAESINALIPALSPVIVGVVTLLGLAAVAYRSADLALKSQYFILGLIVLSLLSFFFGDAPEPVSIPPASVPPRLSFWVVFAVFFPAVTGIEAGISLSGDLKDPARSLPLGTLAAVATGYAVYIAIPLFLSQTVSQDELLLTDPLIMQRVSAFGPLILAGLWGATLSSAMGALLGAPRTLQALARDRVIPAIVGKGFGDTDDPRYATLLSFGVAMVGVVAGDLNVIAPILSMFFLTSYGLLNLSSGLAGLIGSPSWRPTFRVHWSLSLAGAAGCLVTMMLINAGATVGATIVCGGVYAVMTRRRLRATFGDIRQGVLMLAAQFAVEALDDYRPDARNWRPNLLVLGGSPRSRWHLVELAAALAGRSGVMTFAAVLPREGATEARSRKLTASIRSYLQRHDIQALVKVHRADTPLEGAQELVSAYGFGPLVPNTVLVGATSQPKNFEAFARLVLLCWETRRNLVVVLEPPTPEGADSHEATAAAGSGKPQGRVDVWWSRKQRNAGLMVALGYLLKTNPAWEGSRLVLRSIVDSDAQKGSAEDGLARFVDQSRTDAEAAVIVRGEAPVFDTIRGASQGASLVMLGLRAPTEGETAAEYGRYYEGLLAQIKGLPSTALVLAAEEVDFHRLFAPDSS